MGHGICLAWDCPFRRSKNHSKSSIGVPSFYQTAATRLAPPPGLQVLAHVFQQRQRPIAAIQDVPKRMIQKSVHMVHENREYREYHISLIPPFDGNFSWEVMRSFFWDLVLFPTFSDKATWTKTGHHVAIGFQGVSSIFSIRMERHSSRRCLWTSRIELEASLGCSLQGNRTVNISEPQRDLSKECIGNMATPLRPQKSVHFHKHLQIYRQWWGQSRRNWVLNFLRFSCAWNPLRPRVFGGALGVQLQL